MSCEERGTAIRADRLSKCYPLYDRPQDRLWQFLWRGRRRFYREFRALDDASFELARGDALGIVGRNGAGKSTLLQLVCGTLQPTSGTVEVNGRVAALLELGAGFNPEFTGRENVFLNAAILGVPEEEIRERFGSIVDFSGIRDFIDQPVKTYSSGMYVRLAFAVATSIEPDILVIDEALSVGDGAFARKSFDRIMELRERGTTLLFCSHALYQVEALCSRAIWLDGGKVAAAGDSAAVTAAYRASLGAGPAPRAVRRAPDGDAPARLTGLSFFVDDAPLESVRGVVRSRKDRLTIRVAFVVDPGLAAPSVAVSFVAEDGRMICGLGSANDGLQTRADPASGAGIAEVAFPRLPLLRGCYRINVVLACERALHVYEAVEGAASIEVVQDDLEQGVTHLPHEWRFVAGAAP